MFEVGQLFNKNGYSFCVLDIINYNTKKYVLFSVEKNKIEYLFYEIFQKEKGYELKQVYDNDLEHQLFNIIEKNRGDSFE